MQSLIESINSIDEKMIEEAVGKTLAKAGASALAALGMAASGYAAHDTIKDAIDSHQEEKAAEYIVSWQENEGNCDAVAKECLSNMGLTSEFSWVLPKIGDQIVENSDGTYSSADGSKHFNSAVDVFNATRNLLNEMSTALHQRYAMGSEDEPDDYKVEITPGLSAIIVTSDENGNPVRRPLRMEYRNGKPFVRCATCGGGESNYAKLHNKASLLFPTK